MTEYEIQPLSLCCARTGRELNPGELYYSVIRVGPEGFVRTDFCTEAWTGPSEDSLGYWRSTVPHGAGKKRQRFVDDSVILDFFLQLEGETEGGKQSFRYILALLLLRKKSLKLATLVHEGESEILVLRATATGEEYRVVNPELSEQQLLVLQTEVEKVLQTHSE